MTRQELVEHYRWRVRTLYMFTALYVCLGLVCLEEAFIRVYFDESPWMVFSWAGLGIVYAWIAVVTLNDVSLIKRKLSELANAVQDSVS